MSQRVLGWIVILFTAGAVLGNAYIAANPLFAKAAIAFAVIYHAAIFGARLNRGSQGVGAFLLGLGSLLASQSVIQVAFYYIGMPLDAWSDALSLTLSLCAFQIILPIDEQSSARDKEPEPIAWSWVIALLIPAAISLFFVLKGSSGATTDLSIRTPWPLLPVGTLAAIVILAMSTWLAAWKSRSIVFTAILASATVLAVSLIAPLLYSIGFGFDGFLHRASEKLLLETGTISPKPLYYMGQYVLVTWLSRLTDIPLDLFDRFLVPILAACLPLMAVPFFKRDEKTAIAALVLFLPLSVFVVTTPQSLAYVAGLGAILFALNKRHPLVAITWAAWSLSIHPLAGMPFAAATLAFLAPFMWLRWLFVLAGIVSVPAAFAVLNTSQASVSWDFSRLFDGAVFSSFLSSLQPPQNRVALWADWTVLAVFLTPLVAFAGAIIAAWKDRDRRELWLTCIVLAVGTALAGFILRAAGDFAFLIDYERGNYADRLFLVANLFLVVPAAIGFARGIAASFIGPPLTIVTLLLGLAAWHGALAYAALPRHDAANVSRGWSVGAADVEAVRWIDRDAGDAPYTVLANQSVSAAAVRELGFKRYANDVFFYPIPTGGPLYQQFLDSMDPRSSTDTIREAGRLGQSKLIYVVLNDYWWNAQKTGETLSALAQNEQTIRNGKVRIFRFDLK